MDVERGRVKRFSLHFCGHLLLLCDTIMICFYYIPYYYMYRGVNSNNINIGNHA